MFDLTNVVVQKSGRTILDIDQLRISPDQFTVILGHNGSGKSTLMNVLARQIQPDTGDIQLNGQPINHLSQRQLAQLVAFLPQNLPEVSGLTVRELVKLGRFPWRGTLGRYSQEDHDIIEQAMQQSDVAQFADHLTDQLSGGERQRAWVAMLLAQQSPMVLLDEPTSALDLAHQYELMSLLRQQNQQSGLGVIAILHDVNLATRYADRVIALQHGRMVYDGSAETLLSTTLLSELYGIDIQVVKHPNLKSPVAVVA